MEALQRALAGDHAQTHIASVSSLGLVEMTRKTHPRQPGTFALCGVSQL